MGLTGRYRVQQVSVIYTERVMNRFRDPIHIRCVDHGVVRWLVMLGLGG